MEEGFFSKFPLDHVSASVARSVNFVPHPPGPPLPSLSLARRDLSSLHRTLSAVSLALDRLYSRSLSHARALSRAFYSHSNGSTLICMLRVLAGLPATLPSGFPFKLAKWRWLRGATKFFIERFDVDSANGPDKKKKRKRKKRRKERKEKRPPWKGGGGGGGTVEKGEERERRVDVREGEKRRRNEQGRNEEGFAVIPRDKMPFICAAASSQPLLSLTLRWITAFISLQNRLSRFFHVPNVPWVLWPRIVG